MSEPVEWRRLAGGYEDQTAKPEPEIVGYLRAVADVVEKVLPMDGRDEWEPLLVSLVRGCLHDFDADKTAYVEGWLKAGGN